MDGGEVPEEVQASRIVEIKSDGSIAVIRD